MLDFDGEYLAENPKRKFWHWDYEIAKSQL